MKSHHYVEVVDTYLRYLNEGNPEGITSLYAKNASVEDPADSSAVEGEEALRKFYSNIKGIDLKVS